MSKKHYKFNPKTLAYEEVRLTIWKRLFKTLLIASPSIVMGLALAFFFSRRLDSPKESMLKQELKATQDQLLALQHDMEDVNKVLDVLEEKDRNMYRQAFYAEEYPTELRQLGIGGSDRYEHLKGFSSSDLMIQTSEQMDLLEQRLLGQSNSFNELLKLAKNKEKMLACIPAIQPVRNSDLKRMASGYGWRIDPVYKTKKMHTGMDFTADKGTEVYVTGDGVVEEVERKVWGYGLNVVVNHGYGYKTRYAHLSKANVRKGQKLKRGDLVGLVGSTGKSTGPHLHYEVEKNGKKLNPIGFYHSDLTPEQYEKLLEMSEKSYKAMD